MQWITTEHSKDIRFYQKKDIMKLQMQNKFSEEGDLLNYLIKFCKEVIEVMNEK